ncbi:MAG: AIR synthase-related protein [Bacteroidales bacterium]|nr:AIR synthase-related protein [Bacteroidales bacterium]
MPYHTQPQETTPATSPTTPEAEKPLTQETMQNLGLSQGEQHEIGALLGRNPTANELSTLLAMWDASGRAQSLLAWLKGQPRSEESHDYLVEEKERDLYNIHEPRVVECISIAHSLFGDTPLPPQAVPAPRSPRHGNALYMTGRVSASLARSEYARRYLHLATPPLAMEGEEEAAYLKMILDALQANDILRAHREVARGGLFGTLLAALAPLRLGFDILSYREVRLDAFLFGEEGGRRLTALPSEQEDFFLRKMDDARISCCYLGRVTKGRILVDDMDFGPLQDFFLP